MFIRVFRFLIAHEAVSGNKFSEKLANLQFVYFRLMNMLPSKIESNRRQTAAS